MIVYMKIVVLFFFAICSYNSYLRYELAFILVDKSGRERGIFDNLFIGHVPDVCGSVLQRICKENGIARWPYRKVKSCKVCHYIMLTHCVLWKKLVG